ncbi:MAG: ABC transporter ATP-binding protein [bacterium]|nr:ABC transporter ATP-binding protein [Gammaproteobacteria bacterium]HIL98170.1 ABC transporter ATP-binding protein [Pseudomonadales bacterium]
MIKLEQLSKRFQTDVIETTVINDINLEINTGEFVTIMGPSGCGKSTLMNILGLIERPDVGRYLFNGIDVTSSTERQLTNLRRNNIGFIFQNFNLIDELNVFENVELPLLYIKDMSR